MTLLSTDVGFEMSKIPKRQDEKYGPNVMKKKMGVIISL